MNKESGTSEEYQVASAEAVSKTSREWLLLDVRSAGEYAAAHIEGSVLHSLQDLDAAAVRQLMEGQQGCAVICQSGTRARQAASRLIADGVRPVVVLDGGLRAWEEAGLPVKRGKGVISLERQVRIAAGALVFLGAVLAYLLNPAWILLSGFVGAGLMFAGITDTCGMGMLLARMPWNRRTKASCCS